jgi:ABC-type oligopeptide transport system substrate-binding subunit
MRRPGLWLAVGVLAAGIGLLVAAGCGSSSSSGGGSGGTSSGGLPAHINGGTLTAAMHGDIDFIDPALAYYQTSWQIEYATCVKLLNYPDVSGNAGKVLQPEAASGYTVSSNGETYTFTVPPGKYKFNTGEPVTAATFQHALERDLSPKQQSYFGLTFLSDVAGASGYKGLPAHVSGIKVTGDKLAVTLTQKDAGFLSKIATPFACAIPKNTPIDSKGVQSIAGAGPYYIASWVQHRSLVLKKNPFYHGPRPHYLNEIDYTQLTLDQNQGTLELKNGQLDYCPDCVALSQSYQLNQAYGPTGTSTKSSGDQRFFITPAAIISYFALNTARPTFQNPLVREAVNWAIDRPAIEKPYGYGYGTPGDKILPPALPGSQFEKSLYPTTSPTAADIAKAKALIKQSGVKLPLTAIEYSTAGTESVQEADAVLQSNLAKIGITVKTKDFTRALQFQNEGVKGVAMDIANEGWIEDYPDPYDFMNILLNGEKIPATGGNNFAYFDVPKYNEEMDHANTLSGNARYQAYGSIATSMMQTDPPWAPWLYTNNIDFFGPKVGCTVDTPSYIMDLTTMCLRK